MQYKIVKEDAVIDIIENPIWLKAYNNMLVTCDAKEATGILSSNGRLSYHMNGMNDVDMYDDDTLIIQISDEEADEIKRIIDLGGTVNNDNEIVAEKPAENNPKKDATVEDVRAFVIDAMSRICNSVIEYGVDVELSSGQTKHFSLTIEDQLNLVSFQNLAASGIESVPYHADGELCTYYSINDINAIINAATKFKTYHTTYFNSLKNWISSMKTKEEILAVNYGDPIPEEYQSEVMKNA